jgi:hypothetical protein
MADVNETLFPIPEGMTKEQVMQNWEKWNKKVAGNDALEQQLASQFPLFKTFSDIRKSGADVAFSTDVDEPDDNSGVALALRLVGATGQGLASLAGPVGAGAGIAFGGLANAAANVVDSAQGNPTEAVPFSSLIAGALGVKNPATTGSPILDAAAEASLDSLAGMGVLSKMGHSASKILGKGGFREYAASRLDPSFVESLGKLEGDYGLNVPLVLKQQGVGGTAGKALSSVVSSGTEDTKLLNDTIQGLESSWRNAFKLNLDDHGTSEEVIAGFNSGVRLGKTLEDAVLTPAQRASVIGMTRQARAHKQLQRVRNGHMINFINSDPRVTISRETLVTLNNARKRIDALDVTGDSQLAGIGSSIKHLQDKIFTKGKPPKVSTDEWGTGFVLDEGTEDIQRLAKGGVNSARTILELINAIDNKVASLGKLPQSSQTDVTQQLLQVRDAVANDLKHNLTPQQLKLYSKYQNATEVLNDVPKQILGNIAAGEVSGFMSTMIRDKKIAKRFMEQGIVTKDEAKSIAGEFLFDSSTKADGSIDFVKMKKMLDEPKGREGLLELMGSDSLQLLRHFSNVASNLKPAKTSDLGTYGRHALSIAGSSMVLSDPMNVATNAMAGVALSLSANTFLKKLLFNPKIGRAIVDAAKEPPNSKSARQAFSLAMSALNGHEAIAIYYSPSGEEIGQQHIVIRQGPRGLPRYVPLDE